MMTVLFYVAAVGVALVAGGKLALTYIAPRTKSKDDDEVLALLNEIAPVVSVENLERLRAALGVADAGITTSPGAASDPAAK